MSEQTRPEQRYTEKDVRTIAFMAAGGMSVTRRIVRLFASVPWLLDEHRLARRHHLTRRGRPSGVCAPSAMTHQEST